MAQKDDKLFASLREKERVQFARLIDEMMAALDSPTLTRMVTDMAKSMDLPVEEVNKLLDRAVTTWEAVKATAWCR
jgi:hypothetical protein